MTVNVVVGGQFGSEAKGHVAAILCQESRVGGSAYCVRVNGPNAGHSVVDKWGHKWAFRTLPVAAPICPDMQLVIAAGSEIEVGVLKEEIERVEAAGYSVRQRLYIDEQATILTDLHKVEEANGLLTDRLGSTGKGVGAARADRLMRHAGLAKDDPDLHELGFVCDTQAMLQGLAHRPPSKEVDIVIEGTQGFGLGLHAGYYPFCTSGDCRSIDFLACAGITAWAETWVVFRTFPIRVAGNSGPMFNEVTWAQLGATSGGYIQPEQTTVTKKTRRVGMWDDVLAQRALAANQPARAVLTFVDYLDPLLAGSSDFQQLTESPAWDWIGQTETALGQEFELFTTGPDTHIWRNQ